MSLPLGARRRGLIASSSGNHGAALAAVAKMFDVKSTIVMPADAPLTKVENIKRNDGQIIFYDRKCEDRFAIVEKLVNETGMTNVLPYDDIDVMCGQGTIGIEIIEQCKALGVTLDAIFIPSSGGGLSSGITVAVKSKWPTIQAYTVEPVGYDRMARSLASGEPQVNVSPAPSVQDALIGAHTPGKLTFAALLANGAKGLSVSDNEALIGMSALFQHYKLVAEPGGAAAFAATLFRDIDLSGKAVVAICSGGNVDAEIFTEAISLPWRISRKPRPLWK